MTTYRDMGIQAAAQANERIRQESLAYQSTTAPLIQVNDTLKDIKLILTEILELLKKRV